MWIINMTMESMHIFLFFLRENTYIVDDDEI